MNEDVPPECRLDVAREMIDVRRGDYTIRRLQRGDLRCQNDVAIKRSVVGGRSSPLTSFSPECRRLTHCGCLSQRQVFDEGDKCIEPLESLRAVPSSNSRRTS